MCFVVRSMLVSVVVCRCFVGVVVWVLLVAVCCCWLLWLCDVVVCCCSLLLVVVVAVACCWCWWLFVVCRVVRFIGSVDCCLVSAWRWCVLLAVAACGCLMLLVAVTCGMFDVFS